ncbi:leucine--tRNA ligase [Euzebya tangerina]|uniref:leucine--tRNA ligase n=1 Tax=Euzebya tangerina TaxID=591198 RepID=UPI002F2DDF90
MSETTHLYNPSDIEPKWQRYWEEGQTFRATEDPDRPKYYAMPMFPYPSGSGLHVGHPESYTAVDLVARYKRMRGFSVLHPMGFDAFGLPAERAAQRDGIHPGVITDQRIEYFTTQMKAIGFSYDWSREVVSSHADYYRWTQWIFLKLYEKGLAYLEDVPVWWCAAQGTVLANEEVVDNRYVETGDPVERRNMRQWMLRITDYAQELLDDLDSEGLQWPEGVLEMQRQWIGRSEGAEVTFRVAGQDDDEDDRSFLVYTTRPDTLFGATYCVLAPEHELVAEITTQAQRETVEAYVAQATSKSELDRQMGGERNKTGVFTGAYAINPVNDERVPIWVADYVLATYGTGAIMAVPAHDERDHAFARTFGLPIVPTYTVPDGHDIQAEVYVSTSETVVNSGQFDGMTTAEMMPAIIDWLEEHGHGERRVNFKLRDWLFSRQRYWGEPFPILHITDEDGTPTGEIVPVPYEDLPVELPHVDEYKPTTTGEPPLARATEWLHTTAPDGRPALRETNTMPQWAGSCWYYLRYTDPDNTTAPWSQDRVNYWGAVDLYIGGVEHAVLHLLYASFWHKVLHDLDLVPTREPFMRLANQGDILANSYRESGGKYHHPDDVEERPGSPVTMTSAHDQSEVTTTFYVRGTDTPVEQKAGRMGKSLNNGVDPMDVIARYGADSLRLYEMFMGPLEQTKVWNTSGVEGVHRFLSRVWRLFIDTDTGALREMAAETSREQLRALHTAIRETTTGIEDLKVNTPIAKMMELVNTCSGETMARPEMEQFLLILSPYAPHLAEELWSRMGHDTTLAYEAWPEWDEAALAVDSITIAIQVQGKLRGTVEVPSEASKDDILAAAKDEVADHLDGKEIRKEIVVPGRLVNFVVG